MPTAVKKARRASGIPFVRAQKVGTPVHLRSFITQPVRRTPGDAWPAGASILERMQGGSGHRSNLRVIEFIRSGGIKK